MFALNFLNVYSSTKYCYNFNLLGLAWDSKPEVKAIKYFQKTFLMHFKEIVLHTLYLNSRNSGTLIRANGSIVRTRICCLCKPIKVSIA